MQNNVRPTQTEINWRIEFCLFYLFENPLFFKQLKAEIKKKSEEAKIYVEINLIIFYFFGNLTFIQIGSKGSFLRMNKKRIFTINRPKIRSDYKLFFKNIVEKP